MGQQSESTFGRRDIIKKSAVAGAVVWTAPMIVSSRALASDHSPDGGPVCDNFARGKIEAGGPTLGTLFCELDKGYVQANPTTQAVVIGSYSESTGGCFTLASDVTLVAIIGKKRAHECNDFTPVGIANPGGRYCVPAGQSHIMVVVCSDKEFSGTIIDEGITDRALPPLNPSAEATGAGDVQTDQVITGTPEPDPALTPEPDPALTPEPDPALTPTNG